MQLLPLTHCHFGHGDTTPERIRKGKALSKERIVLITVSVAYIASPLVTLTFISFCVVVCNSSHEVSDIKRRGPEFPMHVMVILHPDEIPVPTDVATDPQRV